MSSMASSSGEASRVLILAECVTDAQVLAADLQRARFNCECRQMSTRADLQTALADFSPDVILAVDQLPPCTTMDTQRVGPEPWRTTPVILVTSTQTAAAKLNSGREAHDHELLDGRAATSAGELIRALETLQESRQASQAIQEQLIQVATQESMGRLAGVVAHEVKNPLTAIVLGVEYLRKHLPNGIPEAAEVLDDMDAAVKRAGRVIQNMLDFSMSNLLRREPAHVEPILERALGLLDRDRRKRGIVLERRLAANLPQLTLDTRRLEQVFLNVLQNALEAMDCGGTLTVTTGVKRLGEVVHVSDDFSANLSSEVVVAVDIDDTGGGIPAESLTKVFDPFFTTKPRGQGTGLGLTVSKKIVDLHGGLIQIRNRDGCGVRVSLLLPVETAA